MQIKNIVNIISYLIAFIPIIPLIKYIPVQYILFFVITAVLSFKFEVKKRLFLNLFAIISILFILRNISINNFIIPILISLIILLSIKFLEKKMYRDYMQIYLLSLLLLAGFALLSISISFLFYLVIILVLLSMATVFLTYFDENENLYLNQKHIFIIIYKTFFIFLLSLPLAITIFIILPRVETPFFNFFNNDSTAITGFTDRIRLGDVSSIQEDNSVIFRVNMKKLPNRDLYWRGIVLNKFNGKTWIRGKNIPKGEINFNNLRLIEQVIYLEPYYNRYLFALDKPVAINLKKLRKYNDLTFEYPKQINKRIRYKAYSALSENIFEKNIDKRAFLELPQNISEKLVKLSSQFKNMKDIEKFFKNSHLKYSLENLPVSDTPTENFLFKYKRGNCEYFASSFALLLRLIKIPSRIVAGYKGGLYSNIGKYYIVTQKDAHVWVEAYINQKWVKIDPVIFAENTLPQHNKNLSDFNYKLIIDLMNYYWITMFINYDFNKQFAIVKNIVFFNFNMLKLKKIFITITLILIIFFTLFAIYKNFKKFYFQKLEKEKILLIKFFEKLEKLGYKRKTGETLHEFVVSLKDKNLRKKSLYFPLNG